jgi:hypothetical protein
MSGEYRTIIARDIFVICFACFELFCTFENRTTKKAIKNLEKPDKNKSKLEISGQTSFEMD